MTPNAPDPIWSWWCKYHGAVAAEACEDLEDAYDEDSHSTRWSYECPICHHGVEMVDMSDTGMRLRDAVLKARARKRE